MVKDKFPKRGDLVWVDLDPTLGHEQGGWRPAVVLSNSNYNKVTGFIVICPITTQKKNYFFEVEIETKKKDSVVLVNHVRNIDWRHRKIEIKESISDIKMKEISDKLAFLLADGE